GAVDEEEVVTKIGPTAEARGARPTRGRVRRHRSVSRPDDANPRPDGGDRPRELVAEDRWHSRDHDRVTAPERLHVRATGQRRLDAEHHLAGPGLGNGRFLEPEVAGAVEDLRLHAPTSTKTLSASRRSIRPTASARRSSGSR